VPIHAPNFFKLYTVYKVGSKNILEKFQLPNLSRNKMAAY
jgi:hypothetical protein